MNPTAIRRALYGKLAGDSTLNGLLATPPPSIGTAKSIFYGHAPDAASFPFVIFNKQSGTPVYANVSKPAYETDIWLFKAVDKNSTADPAEAISARLNTLLQDASLSIAGGDTVMWLRRDNDSPTFLEVVDGVTYVHSGSLYRLTFEPA